MPLHQRLNNDAYYVVYENMAAVGGDIGDRLIHSEFFSYSIAEEFFLKGFPDTSCWDMLFMVDPEFGIIHKNLKRRLGFSDTTADGIDKTFNDLYIAWLKKK